MAFTVAEKSKSLAELYALKGSYGRSYSHYLVALNLRPDWKPLLKDEFCVVLCM